MSERKRESLENVLKATRKELQYVKERRAATEDSLRKLEERHTEIQAKHENVKREHGTLPATVSSLRTTVKSLEEDVKRITGEKDNISLNLNSTKTELGQAQSDLRRSMREKNQLEKELIRVSEHSRRQDDNEKRLQASVESLRQQLIQQHTEFDKVKGVQLEAVKRHDEETINRMRAQNERVASTETSLQNVRSQFEQHQEKAMQLRQKYVNEKIALENKILQLKNEIQKYSRCPGEGNHLREEAKNCTRTISGKGVQDGRAVHVNLQNEYTALNKLLESVQNDKVSTIDAP